MLKKLLPALALTVLGLLNGPAAQAQAPNAGAADGPRPCDFDAQQAAYFAAHPAEETRYLALLRDAANPSVQQRTALNAAPDVTVPVVIHIFYSNIPSNNTNSLSNISDRQINDAIDRINIDYQKRNDDTATIVPQFVPLIANVGFKFRLAKLDPSGNRTTGITRHYTYETNYGTASAASVVYWDPNRYLNIWIVDNIASGAGGYTFGALCPGGASTDGIVLRNAQFGPNNRCTANLCTRSLTHEIGHFFGLPHTWGHTNTPGAQTNCNLDDGIADTPNTAGYDQALGACNTNYGICNDANGQRIVSNVQNYMDYANCEQMFTNGQRAVMRGLLTDPRYSCRGTLVSAANLASTGTNDGYVAAPGTPIVAFNPNKTSVCEGSAVSFRDYSYNTTVTGVPLTYSWSFPGGTPSTVAGTGTAFTTATTTYATPGFYGVSLTVGNATVGYSTTNTPALIQVYGAGTGLAGSFRESFETPNFFTSSPPPSQRGYTTSGSVTIGVSNLPGYPSATVRWAQRNSVPAADGSYYLVVTNDVYTPKAVSVLNTPSLNLSGLVGTPYVEFSRYFSQRPGSSNDELLTITASTDCGLTYASVATLTPTQLYTAAARASGDSSPNAASDWETTRVDLARFTGATRLLLRFTMTNGTTAGNKFFLDNLRVSTPLATRPTFADRGIALYPNPLTNETALHLSLRATSQLAVQVTDVLGRQVLALPAKTYYAGEQTIALPVAANALPAGLYMVRVLLDGQTYSSKLTVR